MKNVNTKLEEQIISLERSQAKSQQYSQCNNIELSGILNDIPEDNLERVVIDICHDSDLEIEPKDIKGCHCLLASRYSRDSNKIVIVRSLFLFLFALTTGISGISAKTCKEEEKSIKSFALAVL